MNKLTLRAVYDDLKHELSEFDFSYLKNDIEAYSKGVESVNNQFLQFIAKNFQFCKKSTSQPAYHDLRHATSELDFSHIRMILKPNSEV